MSWADLFDASAEFDPARGLEELLAQAPARWAVYLFADEHDQPIQLLCVKSLRASLRRRLGGTEVIGPSKRVNYPEVVRRVYWRRVDSTFEADWMYYHAARRIFPESYRGMVGFRPAWFVHVDPDAEFPRYVKTNSIDERPGMFLGPVEDKHAAGKLIEMVEDAFDLCRYYNILTQAPHGSACAYKEMGKCPAPCDGSISMPQYRRMIEWSAAVAAEPAQMIVEQKQRMKQAAAELRFETAGKIKTFVDQLSHLGKGPLRHVRRLEEFVFLSVQPGPRSGTAKLFLITPAGIEHVLSLIAPPDAATDLLKHVHHLAAERGQTPPDNDAAERIGIVAQHLFSRRRGVGGAMIRLEELDGRALNIAYLSLKKKPAEEAVDEEGVMKELQAV